MKGSNNTYNRKILPLELMVNICRKYIDSIGRRYGFKSWHTLILKEKNRKKLFIRRIDKWVKYVGIGENVKVRNISKIGYSLTLEVGRSGSVT